MHCYGSYKPDNAECRNCNFASYCMEAGNPVLLSDSMPSYNDGIKTIMSRSIDFRDDDEEITLSPSYSRGDLLEVISFMLSLDQRTLDYLDEFIKTPGITFQGLADKRNISRQAVHKYLKKQCRKVPEISTLLKIGERRRVYTPNRTFKEEVCRIRKKMSELRLSKPKRDSLCWKRLICSTQSSGLFSTNILKGSALWKSGLKR